MDDLHLEVDLFFGPCNDPECPGSRFVGRERRLDLAWPTREQQRLMDGSEQ